MRRLGTGRRRLTVVLALAGALALAVRVAGIGAHSLWFDEALEWQRAGLPLADLLRGRSIDQDPPLYALALRAWLLLGDGEAWLRLPSALAGAATCVVAGGWAWRRLGAREGAVAALLLALAPVLVYYGQEVNQYALLVLFTTVAFVLFERVSDRGRRADWAAYAGVSVVALVTHYGAVFPVVAFGMALAARRIRGPRGSGRALAAYAGVMVATVAALAWLGLARSAAVPHLQRRLGGTDLAREWAYIADTGWRDVLVFFLLPFSGGPALTAVRVMAALAAVGAVVVWRRGRSGRRAVGLWFFGSLALTYATSTMGWYPLGYRYGLFAAPPLLLALAAALVWPARRAGRAGTVACVVLVGATLGVFAAFNPRSDARNRWLSVPREDLGPVAAYVARERRRGDAVYVYHGAVPAMRYYWRAEGAPVVEGAYYRADGAEAEAVRVRAAAAAHDRVWAVFAHVSPGEREALLDAVLVTRAGRSDLRITDHILAANAAAYALERAAPRGRADESDRRTASRMDVSAQSGYTRSITGIQGGITDMNKTELTAALAKKTGITKVLAGEVVGALFDADGVIAGALKTGDSVVVPGFGSFAVNASKAREGRNPRTGGTIKIPARKRPVFRAGKGLKDVLQ